MALEIRSFLTLSTAHVSQQTAELLDNTPTDNWPVSGGSFSTYGWFLYAHDEDCSGDIPSDLMAVFAFARANGCNYVLFDCDANTVDDLPNYEW